MQVRHRIPTIFNLSMVDVLCCALGCVILLWLINMREFKVRATAAEEKGRLLESTRSTLEDTNREAADARRRLASAEQQARDTAALLQTARSERDLLTKDVAAARIRLMQLEKEALALKDKNSAADERFAKLSNQQTILTRERSDILQRITDLEKIFRERDMLASAARRQADDLAGKLRDSEERVQQLRSAADLLEKSRMRLTDVEARAQTMEKDIDSWKRDLADARRAIVGLEQEKKALSDKALRAQMAVENRFAGITLSGRRVVFLIDMSGSMELLDERTPAPDKWQAVRETVVKIMRSLQDMDRFQVILFSDRIEYPMRNELDWINFDPKTSVDRVLAALAGVRPKGNTNVYAGLQAAFRFRPAGLDTIYLISDGLPTTGEGLTAESGRTLKETERAEILSKHIRNILKTDWNRELLGRPRVRINTLGFFYESPDVGAFLWALARENEGSFVGMSKP